jgi:hypothetical protein
MKRAGAVGCKACRLEAAGAIIGELEAIAYAAAEKTGDGEYEKRVSRGILRAWNSREHA